MPNGALDIENDLIQQGIPKFDVPPMSDLDGLNLNITLPKDRNEGSPLPVLAFVHGGSFTFGSSSYPHYDQSRIVKLSVEMGKPIIAVNFKLADTCSLPKANTDLDKLSLRYTGVPDFARALQCGFQA